LRNGTLSVVEKEQFSNMQSQLIQLHAMVAAVNTSVIQVLGIINSLLSCVLTFNNIEAPSLDCKQIMST
jgi:hypothetical protein